MTGGSGDEEAFFYKVMVTRVSGSSETGADPAFFDKGDRNASTRLKCYIILRER